MSDAIAIIVFIIVFVIVLTVALGVVNHRTQRRHKRMWDEAMKLIEDKWKE